MNDKTRCEWCASDPLLEAYHDNEWGNPTRDDNALFERMSMQIFQAGLNWKMILQKRENLNWAFDNFEISKVAEFDAARHQKLLNTEGIIRNKQKVGSVLHNAKILVEIQKEYGSFFNFIDQLPAELPNLQKAFKARFKFMGPEVTRMFVFNIGKVPPPHDKNCWRNE